MLNPLSKFKFQWNLTALQRAKRQSTQVLKAHFPPPGPAGSTERVSDQSNGGPSEADRDQQCHTEPTSLPHAEGKSRAQPRAGCSTGELSARCNLPARTYIYTHSDMHVPHPAPSMALIFYTPACPF